MRSERPVSTRDLFPSEKRLMETMQRTGFGRFEGLQIEHGRPVLDPGPTVVRSVHLGSDEGKLKPVSADFTLKKQVADLFAYLRSIKTGRIRRLDLRYGLPVSMELEEHPHTSERWTDA